MSAPWDLKVGDTRVTTLAQLFEWLHAAPGQEDATLVAFLAMNRRAMPARLDAQIRRHMATAQVVPATAEDEGEAGGA